MAHFSKYSRGCMLLFLCALFPLLGFSQAGFRMPISKKFDKIAIEIVNNLPIVPVEVNGAKLSFILDTGVKSSILFSLYNTDSIQINNTTTIQLQGLGDAGFVEAIKSQNNVIKVGSAVDVNHTLFVIFDDALNFSPRMGVPIHGILGSDFFSNFIVKIDYANSMLEINNPSLYTNKKCRKCEILPLQFFDNKPYLTLNIENSDTNDKALLLVDSGSSDAIWLFDPTGYIVEEPKNYFTDFLGLGLSGNIFGKRSRLEKGKLGTIVLTGINVAFPDNEAIITARRNTERDGSLGGGILKRFTVTFDYGNKVMYLKKNRDFNKPFNYNMSGIVIEHKGVDLVRKAKEEPTKIKLTADEDSRDPFGQNKVSLSKTYLFVLVPKFIVAELREDSPAQEAGLLIGDEIEAINGKASYSYTLSEIIELFSAEEGKKITLEVNRNGFKIKIKFNLKKIV